VGTFRRIIAVLAVLCICSPVLSSPIATAAHIPKSVATPVLLIPAPGLNRYIVRYRDNASESDISRTVALRGGVRHKQFSKLFNGDIVDLTAAQAAQLNKDTSVVLWVEKDQTVTAQSQVDPSPSWGLDRIDQRALPVNNVYSYTSTGAGVDAYVMDSGILATHSQFAGRVRMGLDVFGGTGTDCNGHGSHVAGTLAGSTYGVAPQASLVSVRVLDCNGSGTVSNVISAIDWVITDHTNRPAVLNLSFAATQSASLESAVDRAFADGIVVVVAAGNANADACASSPSGDRASALTVGATNEADSRASFSNFGKCVDVFAPGSNIRSVGIASNTATTVLSGTSMAAPHVAGLVARYLSTATTATPSTVMDAIIAMATPNVVTSAGTLSPTLLAYGDPEFIAVSPPAGTGAPQPLLSGVTPGEGTPSTPTVPGVTGSVSAIADARAARLSWISATNGGSPITAHIVRVYNKSGFVTQVFIDADTVHVIPELSAGSSQWFTVAAMNAHGVGPFSPRSNAVVPLKDVGEYKKSDASSSANAVPTAPQQVAVKALGHRVVSVSWNPPTNAQASSYEVWVYRSRKVVAQISTISNGGLKLYGLVTGRYSVRVRSINAVGGSTLTHSHTVTVR
jgi:Subtilase family